jgi:hypothetical protein
MGTPLRSLPPARADHRSGEHVRGFEAAQVALALFKQNSSWRQELEANLAKRKVAFENQQDRRLN